MCLMCYTNLNNLSHILKILFKNDLLQKQADDLLIFSLNAVNGTFPS